MFGLLYFCMLLPVNRRLYFGFRKYWTESFYTNRDDEGVKVNIKTWGQNLSDPKYCLRFPGNSCITLWVFAFYFYMQQNGFINTSKLTTNLKVINFQKMGTSLLNIVQYFRRWIPNNTVSQKVIVLFFSKLHAKSEIIYFWWLSVLFSFWSIQFGFSLVVLFA